METGGTGGSMETGGQEVLCILRVHEDRRVHGDRRVETGGQEVLLIFRSHGDRRCMETGRMVHEQGTLMFFCTCMIKEQCPTSSAIVMVSNTQGEILVYARMPCKLA